MTLDSISRRRLLILGAAAGAAGILSGCRRGQSDPTTASGSTPTGSIETESGNLKVFEWAGYELPELYPDYPYDAPKFTFMTSDEQALAKVASGFRPDIVHPSVGYVRDWVDLDLIQPWDPSLLKNFSDLNPSMIEAGQIDGQQYMIPLDWGFSSILYRADKVDPGATESFSLFFDERYAGRISWWDNPWMMVIAGYVRGFSNPWDMTDEELAMVKGDLIDAKKVVRNLWQSQTDMETDFAADDIWITYAWPASWWAMNNEGLDVTYMDPAEGRLSWVEGLILVKDTENYQHAHAFANAWASPQSGEWLISNYAYGHANTSISLDAIPPELVKLLSLDDPSVLDEPRSHIQQWFPRRVLYGQIWSEIKAA
ncbi:MAG: extracellular solute-binding protein [Actinomycetota bacterium]